MNYIKLFKVALLLFTLIIFKFEAKAAQLQFPIGINQDSLVLQERNGKGRVVIQSGEKIKLWLNNGFSGAGELMSINRDTLMFLRNGKEHPILVNNIEKIKFISNPSKRIIGGSLLFIGSGAMVLGGVTLIAGVAMVLTVSANIGYFVLAISPVIGGGGFLIYKGGKKLFGKNKFDLKSNWSIEVN